MTSRKADKKLDLKVRRVLKTNVRGGIKEIVVGGAVGTGVLAASDDQGASWVGPGPRGPSYGSRMPTSDAAATIQVPGLPGIGKLPGSG